MTPCLASILVCRIRVTRLDDLGFPSPGPNNVYVSDKPIQLSVTPQIEAGQNRTLVGGCDCIVAEYKGKDKLKRYDLQFDMGLHEYGLLEMLLGAPAILSAGMPIGMHNPIQVACDDEPQPNVAFEAWSTAWEDDHPSASPFQYIHHVWPSTRWQVGPKTLNNDFAQPQVNGFTRGNPNWGAGIFGDYPEAVRANGASWFTDSIPTAFCGWLTHALS